MFLVNALACMTIKSILHVFSSWTRSSWLSIVFACTLYNFLQWHFINYGNVCFFNYFLYSLIYQYQKLKKDIIVFFIEKQHTHHGYNVPYIHTKQTITSCALHVKEINLDVKEIVLMKHKQKLIGFHVTNIKACIYINIDEMNLQINIKAFIYISWWINELFVYKYTIKAYKFKWFAHIRTIYQSMIYRLQFMWV